MFATDSVITVVVEQEEAGQRVDKFLSDRLSLRFPGLSRARVQQWICAGAVCFADGRTFLAKTRLRGSERLLVNPLPREADEAWVAEPVALTILDEDDDLLVLSKPAGLVVHPAAGHWRGTLLNGLLHLRPALVHLPRAGIVHRLDRDTSGLMVVAKTDTAAKGLTQQLSDRTMGRRYLTLVKGCAPCKGVVDAPIGRDPVSRIRMAVVPLAKGRPARTFFRTLAKGRLQVGMKEETFSLLECRLESGRTHQIRVHLKSIGHPVVGDAVYGGLLGSAVIARQALHAWHLVLQHPRTRQRRQWTSPMPEEILQACRQVGIERFLLEDDGVD